MKSIAKSVIPRHVGYIVDGNRRWAKKHGLPKYEGHLAGYNAAKDIVTETIDSGVEFVSLYLFSTENWKRNREEVSYLLKLVRRLMTQDLHELIEKNIRVRFLGTEEGLPKEIIKDMHESEAKSQHLTRGTILVCFNYGGQREIVDAARTMIAQGLSPEQITEQTFAHYLYTPDVPPVDVVVRSSGEQRLSNFMLWRAAYSEFIFLQKLWPDLTKHDVAAILEEYAVRKRRFGA